MSSKKPARLLDKALFAVWAVFLLWLLTTDGGPHEIDDGFTLVSMAIVWATSMLYFKDDRQ